jgi:hypothetical protein
MQRAANTLNGTDRELDRMAAIRMGALLIASDVFMAKALNADQLRPAICSVASSLILASKALSCSCGHWQTNKNKP